MFYTSTTIECRIYYILYWQHIQMYMYVYIYEHLYARYCTSFENAQGSISILDKTFPIQQLKNTNGRTYSLTKEGEGGRERDREGGREEIRSTLPQRGSPTAHLHEFPVKVGQEAERHGQVESVEHE